MDSDCLHLRTTPSDNRRSEQPNMSSGSASSHPESQRQINSEAQTERLDYEREYQRQSISTRKQALQSMSFSDPLRDASCERTLPLDSRLTAIDLHDTESTPSPPTSSTGKNRTTCNMDVPLSQSDCDPTPFYFADANDNLAHFGLITRDQRPGATNRRMISSHDKLSTASREAQICRRDMGQAHSTGNGQLSAAASSRSDLHRTREGEHLGLDQTSALTRSNQVDLTTIVESFICDDEMLRAIGEYHGDRPQTSVATEHENRGLGEGLLITSRGTSGSNGEVTATASRSGSGSAQNIIEVFGTIGAEEKVGNFNADEHVMLSFQESREATEEISLLGATGKGKDGPLPASKFLMTRINFDAQNSGVIPIQQSKSPRKSKSDSVVRSTASTSSNEKKVLSSSASNKKGKGVKGAPTGLHVRCKNSANGSTALTKRGEKRKPRTYSQAVPSQHCHICSRRPTEASPHAVCGNLLKGRCRKTICTKCFHTFRWDLKAVREGEPGSWECPHCRGACPQRAQCVIYNRTSDRRRMKQINHRKRKAEEGLIATREEKTRDGKKKSATGGRKGGGGLTIPRAGIPATEKENRSGRCCVGRNSDAMSQGHREVHRDLGTAGRSFADGLKVETLLCEGEKESSLNEVCIKKVPLNDVEWGNMSRATGVNDDLSPSYGRETVFGHLESAVQMEFVVRGLPTGANSVNGTTHDDIPVNGTGLLGDDFLMQDGIVTTSADSTSGPSGVVGSGPHVGQEQHVDMNWLLGDDGDGEEITCKGGTKGEGGSDMRLLCWGDEDM